MAASTEVVRISRRVLDRYLLDDETPVVATRQHWAKLAEPFATALVALLVVGALTASLDARTEPLGTVLWVLFLVVLGRAVWRLLEWHHEWFVATDRRMLMVYGLVTHKVAMMPLRKVTDMNYGRSLLGRLFGYGQFVLESAGQDQAMRKIGWVPDPDEKYRRICATIFGADGGDEDDNGRHHRPADAFHQHLERDPWETSFDDEAPSPADRFDPDIVHVAVRRRSAARRLEGHGSEGRRSEGHGTEGHQLDERRRDANRPDRWQPVERYELPTDWEWVDDGPRRGRSPGRRGTVAVDPDPTPPWQ